eukprot:Em0004g1127a
MEMYLSEISSLVTYSVEVPGFIQKTRNGEKRNLNLPVDVLLYNAKAVSQEEDDSCSSNTSFDESSTSDSDQMDEVGDDGVSRLASNVSEGRTNCSNRDPAAESNGNDDRIVLDSVEWRKMGDVTVELNGPAYQRKAALHHPLHKRSTELDFWKMMMPADNMCNIIEATNLHAEMAQKPLDYEQLQHFFGILLVMTLASGGVRRDMNRSRGISPGVTLCADKSIGSWRGLAANVDDAVVGLPHVTEIARKPEGVGTESRTLSCGETKIMLQLEIQEVDQILEWI